MLELLVGSRSVSGILLFLFVNGRGYPSQIASHLGMSLTAVQSAMKRLGASGIVFDRYEGKNRLYEFNLNYPLYYELEGLIKKFFLLLPSEKKKKYLLSPTIHYQKKMGLSFSTILSTFWKNLCHAKTVVYVATYRNQQNVKTVGQGKGDVSVEEVGPYKLIFTERGNWKTEDGEVYSYHNDFQWSIDIKTNTITLEHLRNGRNNPMFMFHLVPISDWCLESAAVYTLGDETFFGSLEKTAHGIKLICRTVSPKKNETVTYLYA